MKPMSLNLSKMAKIAGDEHSSTFRHPAGHDIRIAHSGVSALQRQQLKKMPIQKMADGEEATSISLNDPEIPESQANPNPGSMQPGPITSASPNPSDQPFQMSGLSEESPDDESARGPADSSAPMASSPQPQSQVANTSQILADPGKAYQQAQSGIAGQQAIDSTKAKADAEIQAKDIADREKLNQDAQKIQADFMTHQKQLMDDYMAGHINPKHYQESMSTGDKVATGIGLLLGGFSTTFGNGQNPAMDFLNKQIERDITAQESRKDQQKTIMGANQALFHDQALAANQTRVNMNDIYAHKIQQAATQLGTQQAAVNAKMALSSLAFQNSALLQQNAMRATVLNHINQGGAGLTALDLAAAGMIPQPEAVKEQASIDAQKTAIAKSNELYDTLNKEQSTGNLINPQSFRRVAAAKAELVNAVMNASASKRLTRESVEAEIAPLEIKTTDDQQTRDAKRQGLLNIIQRHADPTPYMTEKAPKSLPDYGQKMSPMEGKTATGPNGQRIMMKNGRWVPYGG